MCVCVFRSWWRRWWTPTSSSWGTIPTPEHLHSCWWRQQSTPDLPAGAESCSGWAFFFFSFPPLWLFPSKMSAFSLFRFVRGNQSMPLNPVTGFCVTLFCNINAFLHVVRMNNLCWFQGLWCLFYLFFFYVMKLFLFSHLRWFFVVGALKKCGNNQIIAVLLCVCQWPLCARVPTFNMLFFYYYIKNE